MTEETTTVAPEIQEGESQEAEEEFTEEIRVQIQNAYYYWHTHGYPEKAAVLFECMEQKRLAPANLLMLDSPIQPQTSVDPTKLDMPERAGPNATHKAWREFAKKTLEMDHEIIDTLSRDEIVKILESNKVIPKGVQSSKK